MPTFPSTPGYIAPAVVDVDADVDAVNNVMIDTVDDSESPTVEPTFPDVVILKQTDHNYIVKHNHYPIHPQKSSSVGEFNNDLVSPNQIHKGQINKKRGRKPKAGLILNSKNGLYDTTEVPNIILHLKCHVSDLKTNDSIYNYNYTPLVNEVESYTAQSNYLHSSDISSKKMSDDDDSMSMDDNSTREPTFTHASGSVVCSAASISSGSVPACASQLVLTLMPAPFSATGPAASASTGIVSDDTFHLSWGGGITGSSASASVGSSASASVGSSASVGAGPHAHHHHPPERYQRDIMKKIHRLKHSFHNGEMIQTKMNNKCACFWDTYEFDGPIFYIPIMLVNDVFQVTGCYCSPQCAMAALLKESLDTSTKFERLHLLHLLYGSPNSSSNGFKPAPNPHYLLDKYYGNLTIQEYRALLKGTTIIHIVNKPLTHILPELYEDNNDFMVNSKVIPTNSLKMKKKYKTMVVQSGAE